MRRIEQRCVYTPEIADEWQPDDDMSRQVRYMRNAEVREWVREWNQAAKARGDNTRVRSVDIDDDM